MQVKLTNAAISAYADDLAGRSHAAEAMALADLQRIFKGFLTTQVKAFVEFATVVDVGVSASLRTSGATVADVLPALERLDKLMAALSNADRRKDVQALLKFLRRYESVSISVLVDAVQSARRGPINRPTMTLDQIKAQLDPSLGDDARFKSILAQLKLLDEKDFADVAKTALEVPFKNKKEGLARLNKLHATTRSNRMKEAAASNCPA